MAMRAYARSRDLDASTISRQVRDGLIPVHGPKRLINPREADRHLRKHRDPARRNGKGTSPDAGLNTARAGHTYWKAELARLELEKRRRQVLETLGKIACAQRGYPSRRLESSYRR